MAPNHRESYDACLLVLLVVWQLFVLPAMVFAESPLISASSASLSFRDQRPALSAFLATRKNLPDASASPEEVVMPRGPPAPRSYATGTADDAVMQLPAIRPGLVVSSAFC